MRCVAMCYRGRARVEEESYRHCFKNDGIYFVNFSRKGKHLDPQNLSETGKITNLNLGNHRFACVHSVC